MVEGIFVKLNALFIELDTIVQGIFIKLRIRV